MSIVVVVAFAVAIVVVVAAVVVVVVVYVRWAENRSAINKTATQRTKDTAR